MGAICGPGGSNCNCCRCVDPNAPPPIYPVGYGLGCCGLPGACCGYGEGLGPGGPFSCGGDCCGTSGIVFGSTDYFDYFCCGCCGITQNRCCGCGSGVARSGCGGNGYCGGGCCCCCYEDYPMNRTGQSHITPLPVPSANSIPTLQSIPVIPSSSQIMRPPTIIPQRLSTPPIPLNPRPVSTVLLPNQGIISNQINFAPVTNQSYVIPPNNIPTQKYF